jgi:hypothetical protein
VVANYCDARQKSEAKETKESGRNKCDLISETQQKGAG